MLKLPPDLKDRLRGWLSYLWWRLRGIRRRDVLRWSLRLFLGGFSLLLLYTLYLDFKVRSQFEGVRWTMPARVYARPLELFPALRLGPAQLQFELQLLGYRQVNEPMEPGSYHRDGDVFQIITRPFEFWDGAEPSVRLALEFHDGQVLRMDGSDGDGNPVGLVRLDPAIVGSIHPAHNEDRVLLSLDEVPQLLIDALLLIEDQHFYEHWGVRPQSILRALAVNIRAGAAVQGGSTLTQQLVKNFFLTNERTLTRKFNEAIMSLLLELHYDKDEILEAYMNEIFLGQDGKRAIHGFGLASQFYFQRHLKDLKPAQVALLVALVKGASYYDPRRFPERAKKRRDLVLQQLLEAGKLDRESYNIAHREGLMVQDRLMSGVTEFPAFIDLVRRQLRRDYQEDDLTTQGLKVHTTLNPLVQLETERTVSETLNGLERRRGIREGMLQSAVVVTSIDGGEILALVADRHPRFAGYNRAVDAQRPIGSLIKPVVFVTALERHQQYNVTTLLPDEPFEHVGEDGQVWAPKNFDGEWHGFVPMYQALAKSYNLSTARLGLDLGVESVLATLRRLGVERDINPFPSLFLGAQDMSPMEVAQIYHTFANNGFRVPLRSIRAVLTAEGTPLQRYSLDIRQVFDEKTSFIINSLLQQVVRGGTARSLQRLIGEDMTAAGKTGTSDDTRDSWFAGFTGDRLAVAWVGNDDNMPTGLTGSSGALRVWGRVMARLDTMPLMLVPPEGVDMVWIDPQTNFQGGPGCVDAVQLPFVSGTAPTERAECAGGVLNKTIDAIRGLFRK